jgi:hypothetical protein
VSHKCASCTLTAGPAHGVEMITVDSATISAAEKLIDSCDACNPEHAEVPFDWILDRVTGQSDGTAEYILALPAKCPNCRRKILEETLVEPGS